MTSWLEFACVGFPQMFRFSSPETCRLGKMEIFPVDANVFVFFTCQVSFTNSTSLIYICITHQNIRSVTIWKKHFGVSHLYLNLPSNPLYTHLTPDTPQHSHTLSSQVLAAADLSTNTCWGELNLWTSGWKNTSAEEREDIRGGGWRRRR